MLGQAKLALCFQIPSQASLLGILKAQRSLCCANGPAGQPSVAVDSRLPEASHPAGCLGSLPRGRPAAWVRAPATALGCVYLGNLTRSLPLISPCGPTFGCSTAHLPPVLGCGLKFLAAKRRENAKNDGLTVVKTFYTFHTCLQQQL